MSEVDRQKVAVVTGSSSGIGFETALLLARSGFHTYASMRNLEKSKNITEIINREKLPLQIVQLDVNNDRSVKDAIGKIESEQERIDVLVNNAGYVITRIHKKSFQLKNSKNNLRPIFSVLLEL